MGMNNSNLPFNVKISFEVKTMRKLRSLARGVWQLVSYLFWPQKTDRTRYQDCRQV